MHLPPGPGRRKVGCPVSGELSRIIILLSVHHADDVSSGILARSPTPVLNMPSVCLAVFLHVVSLSRQHHPIGRCQMQLAGKYRCLMMIHPHHVALR